MPRSGTTVTHVCLREHPNATALNDEIGIRPFFERGLSAFTSGAETVPERTLGHLALFDAITSIEAHEHTLARWIGRGGLYPGRLPPESPAWREGHPYCPRRLGGSARIADAGEEDRRLAFLGPSRPPRHPLLLHRAERVYAVESVYSLWQELLNRFFGACLARCLQVMEE